MKKISFSEALMIGIGGMFGLAIFVFPGTTGKMIDGWDIIAWPLTGLLMLTVGMIYSELSSAYKVDGGPVLYIRLVFGKTLLSDLLSFIANAGFYVGWTIAIVIGAITAPQYLAYAFPIISNISSILPPILIISLYAISISGFKRSSRTNFFLTLILLAFSLVYSVTVLSKGNLSNAFPSIGFDMKPFLSSIGIIIGAYGAWVGIPSIYNEIENPGKTVPKAVTASIAFTAGVYTLLVLSIHAVIPYSSFLDSSQVQLSPFSYALDTVGGSIYLKVIFSLAVFLAISTTILVGIMSLGASISASSEYGVLPAKIAALDKKLGGSYPFSALVSVIPSLFLSTFPQYFFQLFVIGLVVGTDLPYIINIASYIVFKLKKGDRLSDFRAPFGTALAISAFFLIGISALNLSMYELKWSLLTITLLIIVFLLARLADSLKTKGRSEAQQ